MPVYRQRSADLRIATRQPANGLLDVSTEAIGQAHHFDLFRLLGRVREILLARDFRGVNGRLHAAQADPHLFVTPLGVVVLVDREDLVFLLLRQPEQRLYAVELGHVLPLVEQDLAVGVVDDRLLDDGRRDDVVDLLRHHDRLAEVLADGLVEILDIVCHIGRRNRFPRLFNKDHFPHALQPSHLVDEGLHDDDRHHGEEVFVVLHRVDFEDDKAFG